MKWAVVLFAALLAGCPSANPSAAPTRGAAPAAAPADANGGNYSLSGVLASSDLYFAGPDAPKSFVLRDPDTKAIRAYVQATRGQINLMPYVGQLVQVVGNISQDKTVGLVLEAQQVKVLGPVKPRADEPPAGTAPSTPSNEGSEPIGPASLLK